jgi:hypothetical protein
MESKYMNDLTKITAAALAALTLSACVEDQKMSRSESAMSRQATSNAESSCMAAVNRNYGGKVRDLRVASSEFLQANSEVIVDAVGERGGSVIEHWRCLVSNGGQVEDLSVTQ